MKKVLFIASLVKHHVMVFHTPYLEWLKKNGYEVHVAAKNDYDDSDDCKIPFCDVFYNLPFERSPLKYSNFVVYNQLKKVIDNNVYDIVHCHTPIGGVLGRLASRKSRMRGTRVIYTAHGFHFFDGAPLLNWILYYPIEKWLSRFTDTLITINTEDYSRAVEKFHTRNVEFVPGVGVDLNNFKETKVNETYKTVDLGISDRSFVILSVGELNKNKNQKSVIRALAKINNSNIHYLICGKGKYEYYLKKLCKKLNLDENVHFLGFRNDISKICKVSDLFVFPSFREGLSLSLMQAMASGLPVICSNIRGNTDLIDNGLGGYLFEPKDVTKIAEYIQILSIESKYRKDFGLFNINKIENFSIDRVLPLIASIYLKNRSEK